MITMGGSDPKNFTETIIKSLNNNPNIDLSGIKIHVVIGASNNYKDSISKLIANFPNNYILYSNLNDMASLMKNMDLIISSAGTTLWECFAIGVPIIAVKIADNQEYNLESCSKANAIIPCTSNNSFKSSLETALNSLLKNKTLRNSLKINGQNICDGMGSKRVANAINSYLYERY